MGNPMGFTASKIISKQIVYRSLYFVLFGVLLLSIFLVLQQIAASRGLAFNSGDEFARLSYARNYAEKGDWSSFNYVWLPLPFIVIGKLARWINNEYWIATRIVHSTLCFLGVLAGWLATWVVAHDSRSNREQITGKIGASLGALLATTSPWTIFGAILGFAEPFAWFALAGATSGFVLATKPGWRFVTGCLIAGFSIGIGAGSRYEIWVLSVLYLPIVAFIFLCQWRMNLWHSVQGKWKIFALAGVLLGAILAITPMAWWISIYQEHYHDPFRMFESTHRFESDSLGVIRPTESVVAMFRFGLAQTFFLTAFLLIAALPRKWSLGTFILFAIPAGHLLVMIVSSMKSGIAWVVPERTLGGHTLMLAFPASLVIARRLIPGLWAFSWKNRALAFLAWMAPVGVMLISQTFLATNPIENSNRRGIATHQELTEVLEHKHLGDGEKIALPAGDTMSESNLLIWPIQRDVLSLPFDWQGQSPEAQLQWIVNNNVALVVTDEFLAPEVATAAAKMHHPNRIENVLLQVEKEHLAMGIITVGKLGFGFPQALQDYVQTRQLTGPQPNPWIRYSALIAANSSNAECFERQHSDGNASIKDLHLEINERPAEIRSGWPDDYAIWLSPGDYYVSSMMLIGHVTFQPRGEAGYYVVVFRPENGETVRYFGLTDASGFITEDSGRAALIYDFRTR